MKASGSIFVLNLINGVKMKLEWLVIKWEWYGKKDQVVVVTFLIKMFILDHYSGIELITWSYLGRFYSKNLSCSRLEEKLINCSIDDYEDICYYYENGYYYYYATAKCIKGILYHQSILCKYIFL